MGWFSKKKKEETEQRTCQNLSYYTPYSSGLMFSQYQRQPYMSLSSVFAAIETITNAIAEIPIVVKQNKKNKTNIVQNHKISSLFHNLRQSKFNYIKQLVWDMILHGNGYSYIKRDQMGTPIDLIYLPYHAVSIHSKPELNELYYNVNNYKGIPYKVMPSDMIHLFKNTNNGYEGRGLMSYASRVFDLANSTESAAEDYFSSGCNIKGILKFNRGIIDDEQKQAIRQSWNEVHGGVKGSGLAVLEGDADFIRVSENASDSQMIETRLFNVQEVCRFFCISPVLLQDLSKSSYSTVEAMNLQFVQYTLMPIISLMEDEFNRKLIKQNNIYLDFEESALLRGNRTDMANYATSLVTNGIMTVNEARAFFGLNPMDGADKLMVAYSDISQNTINDTENTTEEPTETTEEE